MEVDAKRQLRAGEFLELRRERMGHDGGQFPCETRCQKFRSGSSAAKGYLNASGLEGCAAALISCEVWNKVVIFSACRSSWSLCCGLGWD